jgi:alkylation response protein AidB-like acyl-CoA dehydrogenase
MKGIENLSQMNFEISQEQKILLEQVDRACKQLRPIEDKCYLERKYNDQLKPIFAKAGLLGLPISTEYGGGGADILTYALALERIGEEEKWFNGIPNVELWSTTAFRCFDLVG